MSILFVKIYGEDLKVHGAENVNDVFGVVYGAENLINHKIYVGQTTRTIEARFKHHVRADSLIGKAIRKYGLENFVVVILAECNSKEELDKQEVAWIKRLNCKAPFGYNCTDGGDGIANLTEEAREKRSKALSGREFSEEHRANLSAALMGNKNCLGRKHTEEEKRKIREWNLGKKLSPETCEKIRQSKIGTKATQLTKDKMSAKRKGRKFSQAHKDKIAAARRAYWSRVHAEKEQQNNQPSLFDGNE